MYCHRCGKEIDNESVICPSCGVPTGNYQQPPPQAQPNIIINNTATASAGFAYIHKSKWMAFFLCLFFGVFGVHRFYVGKAGTGIIWLLTLGLGGIGWLIDLIVILLGGFRDVAGQPLR